MCDIGVATAHNLMTENLGPSRVSARGVPKLLTSEEEQKRVADSHNFLRLHGREAMRF